MSTKIVSAALLMLASAVDGMTAPGYIARPGYEPHGGWVGRSAGAGTAETPCNNEGCQARPYANFDSSICSSLNSATSPMACQDGATFWDTNSRCAGTGATCQTSCRGWSSTQFFSATAVQRCAALCDAHADCNSFLMVAEYTNNCLLSDRGVAPDAAPADTYRTGWCNGEFKKWWYTTDGTTSDTPAPTTSAPTTSAPTTSAPTTSAPTTSAPTTSAPTTSAPGTTASPTASPTVIHTVSWGLSRVGQASITIETGNTVRWVLDQQGGHNVVSGPAHGSSDGRFQSPWLSSLNDAWSYRFTVAGSFPYYCSPHQNMVANITVVDDLSAITSAPATSAPTLLPSSLPSTASPTTSSPTTSAPTTSAPTTSAPTPANGDTSDELLTVTTTVASNTATLGTDDHYHSNPIAVAGAVLGALGLLLAILVAIRQHTDVKRLEDQIDAISPAHIRHQSNIAARLAADVEQPYRLAADVEQPYRLATDVEQPYSLPAYTTSPRYSAPQGPENVYKVNPNGQSIRLVQPHGRRESTM